MRPAWARGAAAGACLLLCAGCVLREPSGGPVPKALAIPDGERFNEQEAVDFNRTAKARPLVYTRLADDLVSRFGLAQREGIGIDIGGGPGDLVLELAARAPHMYWINTDINAWYARIFAEDAVRRGVAQRTGFVFADAGRLPFRDDYADLVLSRGAYPFWPNLEGALREAHRVLKPGGWAFIGRGFPPSMPEDEVRAMREKGLAGGPKYDPGRDADAFRAIMGRLGVRTFEIVRHTPRDPTVNYGLWLCFRK